MSKEKKGDLYNKMNFIERSQLDRLNQITNSLQREIHNRDNYMASMNNQRNMYSNDIIKQQNHNELERLPDYETLQNMYLQHLSPNIPSEFTNNQLNSNINTPVEKNFNPSNHYHNFGNPQPSPNDRPMSNSDNKKKQQEEYRNVLLNQMREQNERKQKEKLESRGFDIINKRPISTNSVNTNISNTTQVNNTSSMSNNLASTNTNISQNPYLNSYQPNMPIYPPNYNNNNKNYPVNYTNNDPQTNYITKQQLENISSLIKPSTITPQMNNNNFHVSNVPNTKPQEIIDYPPSNVSAQKTMSVNAPFDEKHAEKQKKIEYQNILKRQMEERKERLEGEKKKRMEEEKRIEEQYRVMMEKEKEKEKEQENQKKMKQNMMEAHNHNHHANNSAKQTNNINNNNFNQTNPNLQTSQNTQQNSNINQNKNNSNMYNNINPSLTQEYLNYKDKQVFNPPNDNQDFYNHPHFENNPYDNPVDQYSEQRDFNQKPNYHSQQAFNKFPQQSTNNFNLSNYPQNPNYQEYVPNDVNSNHNFNPMFTSTQNNFGMKTQSNQYMMPSFVDEMCRQFWSEQMKLINQYQQNVYEVMKERDNAIKESLLMRERMFLHNQLQMEQEKIKKSVGYMPFDTNTYYQNLEEMFNNPKLTTSTMNNNVYPQATHVQKNNNNYNHPHSSSSVRKYNNVPEENYYKTKSTSPVKNSAKNIPLNYDELADNSVYEQSGNYQCLDGVSKLVKIFPKTKMDENEEDEQFYETWRDDDTMNNISKLIMNKQNIIAESLKNTETKPQPNTNKKGNVSLNSSLNSKKNPQTNSQLYTNEPPQKESSILNKTSNVDKSMKVEKSKLEVTNTERSQFSVKKVEGVAAIKNINDKNTSLVVNRDRSEMIVNSEENYEASFEVIEENISGDQGKKEEGNEQRKEEINFEEYKEIREKDNEKFKTKVNFFESDGNLLHPGANLINNNNNNQSNLAETINNNRESAQEKMEKYSIIRRDNYNEEEDSHFMEHDDLDELETNNKILNTQPIATLPNKNIGSNQFFDSHFLVSNNNLPSKENDFKVIYNKPDPKERVPREISSNNIDKMNSLYEKYNQMKKTNIEKPKDTSNINFLDETYTNKNLNNMNNLEDSIRKFRPFTANVKEQMDFNNSKLPQNMTNTTNINKIENKKFVYVPSGNDLSNSQNFPNNTIISNANNNDITNCQKINPINDLNNEDSYIKDLTKLRKYALNEIESADLSYVKNKELITQDQRNDNSFIIEYNRKEMNTPNQLKKSSIESNRYQNISSNK